MRLALLLSFLFFISCAHNGGPGSFTTDSTSISDRDEDMLSRESFVRYSEPRLENLKTVDFYSSIAKCHSKDHKEGLKELQSNYKTKKNDPEYWNNIGTCYYLQGKIAKAKFFYDTAIKTAKARRLNYAASLNNLGVMLLKLRHYDEAYKHFKSARKRSPSSLTPIFNLAQFHLAFGEYNRAYGELITLYKRNPKDIDVLAALGSLHLYKKDYNTAIAYFGKINKTYLTRQDIATHYAMALYQIGDYNKAFSMIKNSKNNRFTNFEQAKKELESLIEQKLEKLEEVKQKTAKLRRG